MGLSGKRGTDKKSFRVEGMTCEHCQKSIEAGLKALNGVNSAKVSLKKKEARIIFDPELVTLEELRKKVEELGYKMALK